MTESGDREGARLRAGATFRTVDTGELGPRRIDDPGAADGHGQLHGAERILQLPLDPRSDLFSLGVVMFEMATGSCRLPEPPPSETVSNVLDKDPDPLTMLAPQHKPLEPVVHRLLAKRASDRYASASEVAAALTPLATRKESFTGRLRRLLFGP